MVELAEGDRCSAESWAWGPQKAGSTVAETGMLASGWGCEAMLDERGDIMAARSTVEAVRCAFGRNHGEEVNVVLGLAFRGRCGPITCRLARWNRHPALCRIGALIA